MQIVSQKFKKWGILFPHITITWNYFKGWAFDTNTPGQVSSQYLRKVMREEK